MVLRWLRRVWLWLRHNVIYFLPKVSWSRHDKDSDSEEESVCRAPCDSGTGVFDETDLVFNSPRERANITDAVIDAPKRREKSEIFRLKNKIGPRNGAQADRENIERLLNNAGFESIHVYCDQRRSDTLEIMENISNSPEMAGHDGLVVFISSHGKAKGFQAVDKKIVEVNELTSRVNGKQCAGLRGKPKLFFISACRGTTSDGGVTGGVIDADSTGDEKLVPKLPTEADFLVCYSTTKGYLSHRRFTLNVKTSPGTGTWLISSLTQVFEEKRKHEDIMQMLARVNSRVADMATRDDHVNGMKQMPVQMHMLRHRVFFGK